MIVICLIVPKIKWNEVNKKLLKKSICHIIWVTILVSVIIKLIFGFPEKCLILDCINTILFVIGFIILGVYLVLYRKRFWHDWMFAFIGTIIVILLMISFGVLQPIVKECNKIEPLSPVEKLEQYINDNVKGAIYIYDDETGHENVTIIVCNNGTEAFDDVVTIALYHNISYNVSIRKKEGHNDISSYWGNPTIKRHPKGNFTIIEYSKPNFTITLGDKCYIYANFTIKWDIPNDFVRPFYSIYIGTNQPYIARIGRVPPIQLLPPLMNWDMKVIFNEIIDYEATGRSDW